MKYRYLSALLLFFILTQSCTTIPPLPGSTIVVSDKAVVLPANPSPEQISERLQDSLPKVRSATVSLFAGGHASAVIISPDGYVLTAAHVLLAIKKKDQKMHITLEDGRKAAVKTVGYDRAGDLALLKIVATADESWPYVELAGKSPELGAFCYTLAHPTGLVKGRPAQVRLGRLTSRSMKEGRPLILNADCNIQPGDSGGPLFDLDGRLIGIDSSAAGHIGYNMFGCIDQFLLSKERFFNGEIWGEPLLGSKNAKRINTQVTREAQVRLAKEFLRRVRIQYPPAVDVVRRITEKRGQVELTAKEMVFGLGKDAYPLLLGQEVVLGMDDPAVVKRLPDLSKDITAPVAVYNGMKIVTHGVPVSNRYLLVKLSEFNAANKAELKLSKTSPALKVVGRDKAWDLALIDAGANAGLIPVKWPGTQPQVKTGQALMAVDIYGRSFWGVASGQPYEVKKGRSKGPLRDQTLISNRRAPYKRVLPHSMPLFAKDAATPVYNLQGQLVGVHMARLNRTMGLLITSDDLQKLVKRMMKK